MIQSFIVYTSTALILYILGNIATHKDTHQLQSTGTHTSFWSVEILLSILIFTLIAGLRYNVGVDYPFYLSEYISLQEYGHTHRKTYEQGYYFITKLLADADLHFFFFFAFWAALQISLIYYALRNRKFLLPYIGLFIMLSSFFLDWMNGIRQAVAECFFIYSICFIKERKLIPYIIIILLASLIHKSAIILLPFYFILYKPIKWATPKIYIPIFIACIIIGNTPTWISVVTKLEQFLILLGYQNYVANFQEIFSNLQSFNWGPRRISVVLANLIILAQYSNMRQFYSNDDYLPRYFLLFFLGICLYNLFANTSLEFLRPVAYFTIFTLPMAAYCAAYLRKTNKISLYCILLASMCSYIYFSILSVTSDNNTILYKFFFNSI